MERYDEKLVPKPFPLNNTGAICHFNSLLQALASHPAFVRASLKNEEYMKKTRTGQAVLNYIKKFTAVEGDAKEMIALDKVADDIADHSVRILAALMQDLAQRRPWVKFGSTQESASEGLVHLLDMIEPPVMAPPAAEENSPEPVVPGPGGTARPTSVESPITRLFLHRYRCEVYCAKCRNVVSTMTDLAVQFNLFYFDKLRAAPTSAEEFSESIRRHITLVEDYRCPNCKGELRKCLCEHCAGLRAAEADALSKGQSEPLECKCIHCDCKGPGYRLYRLSMVPEIAVCLFNLYHHPRPQRYIPDRLVFPAKGSGALVFNQTAMIEHFGSLHGGHYIARALRAGRQVYLFNDSALPAPCTFLATPNTYIAMYHFKGLDISPEIAALTTSMSKMMVGAEGAPTAKVEGVPHPDDKPSRIPVA